MAFSKRPAWIPCVWFFALVPIVPMGGTARSQPTSESPSSSSTPAITPAPVTRGGIYAYVVGVSKYNGIEDLPAAGDNAIRFASMIQRTYPTAKISLVVDCPEKIPTNLACEVLFPDRDTMRAIFDDRIPGVPEGALVIVYFAGHGYKVPRRGATASDLYLVLNGIGQAEYRKNSVNVRDVFSAICNTSLTTVIVILDCCYAGPESSRLPPPDSTLRILNIKGIMLASSLRTEQTLLGRLTDAVIKIWSAPEEEDCLTPAVLEKRVRTIVSGKNEFMWPSLWFGRGVDRCLGELGKPACLLVFRFPAGFEPVVRIELKTATHVRTSIVYAADENPDRPFTFARQVSKGPISIRIQDADGTELVKKEYTDLTRDWLIIDVPPAGTQPVDRISHMTMSDAVSWKSAAEFVDAYGGKPAAVYWRAAQCFARVDEHYDTSLLIWRASELEPTNSVYALAAGRLDERFLKPLLQDTRAKDVAFASLVSAGQPRRAGDLGYVLAKRSRETELKNHNEYLAYLGYKAASLSWADQVADKIDPRTLTVEQSRLLSFARSEPSDVVRQSFENLQAKSVAWHLSSQRESIANDYQTRAFALENAAADQYAHPKDVEALRAAVAALEEQLKKVDEAKIQVASSEITPYSPPTQPGAATSRPSTLSTTQSQSATTTSSP